MSETNQTNKINLETNLETNLSEEMEVPERDIRAFTPPKEHFIYRIQYTKGEEVRFIGHLDVMRLFQRAIKRAKLPVAYSKGFNPHQLLSFASPLTLGATSEGEYGDFEMTEKIEPSLVWERLAPELPRGMSIIDAVLLTVGQGAAMAVTAGASYHITMDDDVAIEEIKNSLTKFLEKKDISVMKKTKSKEEIVNIRQDIYDMECKETPDGRPMLYLFLAAGSVSNLKPEPVMRSLYEFIGLSFNPYIMHSHKLQLFRKAEGKFLGLTEAVGVRRLIDEVRL